MVGIFGGNDQRKITIIAHSTTQTPPPAANASSVSVWLNAKVVSGLLRNLKREKEVRPIQSIQTKEHPAALDTKETPPLRLPCDEKSFRAEARERKKTASAASWTYQATTEKQDSSSRDAGIRIYFYDSFRSLSLTIVEEMRG